MTLLGLVLVALASPPAPWQGTKPPKAPDLYRRAVTRTLERVQRELSAGLEFEVDHSRWDDPWVVKTPHFEVRATGSYAETAEIARQLEFMHAEFVRVLGEGNASAPMPIWIFPNIAEYNRFGNDFGAEHSSLLGSFFSTEHPELPVVTYQNGNYTRLGMWVTHSATHLYLERAFGPGRPVWVDEGLASYFALYWDWSYGAQELERIERGPTFVPLERLVRDPIQAYSSRPDDRFTELGMLFNFLLNHCEATKNGATGDPATGTFQEFLRAAVRGQDVAETEFMQTFEEAAALLEGDFKDFDFSR